MALKARVLAPALAALLVAAVAGAAWIGAHRAVPAPETVAMPDLPGFRRALGPGERSIGAGAIETLLSAGSAPASAPASDPAGSAPESPETRAARLCARLWDAPGMPAEGPADAAMRIAVFSDANCPWCRRLDETLSELAAERPDLKIVHHEWPILGRGSVLAARATISAARLGDFRALKTRLLNARFLATEAYLAAAAQDAGLPVEPLLDGLTARETDAALIATDEAAKLLGLRGTPALVVNGALVTGALDRRSLEALIEAEATRPDPCA